MIFARKRECSGFGQERPPTCTGWKVYIEMTFCRSAVPENVAIDPQDAIADPEVGGNRPERQFVDSDSCSVSESFRPCGGRDSRSRY